jgi:SAM-dependent methyltransferase
MLYQIRGGMVFMKRLSRSHGVADYDRLGQYNQDAINGFSDELLDNMLDLVNPGQATVILDAMAGNGNLTLRLHHYCQRYKLAVPHVTLLEYSRVQCEAARKHLAAFPVDVVWGDILTRRDLARGMLLPEKTFDRVMIKSGSHEIPLEKQLLLYSNIFRMLKPGGIFVNLGFLFDDVEERDQFRDITRVKDHLAGMQHAVQNRHFLTHDEFYTRLHQAGFVDVHCGKPCHYTIHSSVAVQAYFLEDVRESAHAELQACQAKALLLRRRGRIHFHGDSSTMICPGEITVARRPETRETFETTGADWTFRSP